MDETPIEKIDEHWQRFKALEKAFNRWWHAGVNKRTLIVVLAIAVPITALYGTTIRAPGDFPSTDIVSITPDQSLSAVAQELADQNVVQSPFVLELVVRVMGGARSVHAGDYQFKYPQTVFSIARAIVYGYFGLEPVRIRIPEGSTAEEMASVYAKYLPRFNKEAFIEKGRLQEGYLYPDTYFFLPNANEEVVLTTMRDTFDKKIAELNEEIQASGRTLHEVVTIASLLEKEAHIYRDRQMIAGVINNRLKKNMALQIDAAFLYFLGRTTFSLTLEDLQYDSPYNTYKYKGLPPGPITNPSFAAIKAALTPVDHNYIFYLADRNGVTYYSVTYEEHLRKKRLYLGT